MKRILTETTKIKNIQRGFLMALLLTASALVFAPAQAEAKVIVRTRTRPVRVVRVQRPAPRRTVVVTTPVLQVKVVKPGKHHEVWIPGHFNKTPGHRAVWIPGHWKTI